MEQRQSRVPLSSFGLWCCQMMNKCVLGWRILLILPTTAIFGASAFQKVSPLVSTRLVSTKSMAASNDDASPPFEDLRILGVCGGIGSGKSSASELLVSELGCLAHLDADKLGHEVYKPGSQAIQDIAAAFGEGVLQENGEEIDRKKLGAIVFAERSEMAKLEQLVWPHMQVLLSERIEALRSEWQEGKLKSEVPVVVLEAAVLLDGNFKDLVDGIWVVTAPREVALQRLMETRGLSKEEAEKRINAQASRRGIGNLEEEVQSGMVTSVIENGGSLDDLTQTLKAALANPKSWK